ncbi:MULTISPECIES: hypothetical protein [Aerosakkonema]|uniref:hypothetical protein n=1 Tax=Aerosakkonema TaxID=1246629 RepID=UPI0035B9C148
MVGFGIGVITENRTTLKHPNARQVNIISCNVELVWVEWETEAESGVKMKLGFSFAIAIPA